VSDLATWDPKADQVGSLLRPDELLAARGKYRRGEIDHSSLSELEDSLIVEALARQRDLGMGVLTDGEFRRDAWQTDVTCALEGFSPERPIVRNTLLDGSVVELEMHTNHSLVRSVRFDASPGPPGGRVRRGHFRAELRDL